MTLLWPRKILPPQNPMFDLAPMTVGGPVSQDGLSDVIAGDAGFWKVTFGSVVVTTRERVMTWNAIKAKLQGRLYPILVPYCSAYQPLPRTSNGVPHSDGTSFSDDTLYRSGITEAKLVSDMAKDAVFCAVTRKGFDGLQAGHRFSIGERLYEVTDITPSRIYFQPPAREAAIAGTVLNFDNPVCRVRLASDREMALTLEGNRRAFPTVNFVEDLL